MLKIASDKAKLEEEEKSLQALEQKTKEKKEQMNTLIASTRKTSADRNRRSVRRRTSPQNMKPK